MALTWQVTQQDTLRIQDHASGGLVIWVCASILLLVGSKFEKSSTSCHTR